MDAKKLVNVIGELNKAKLIEAIAIPKKKDEAELASLLMDAVDKIPAESEDKIPEGVVKAYNALREEQKESETAETAETAPPVPEPPKGKKAGKDKKEKEKKEKNSGKKTKAKGEVNQFQHRINSMGPTLDEMVLKGVKLSDAVKTIVKQFGKTEKRAEAKFKSHANHLKSVHGVSLEVKDGFYKGKV